MKFNKSPHALHIPFDNSTNGYTAVTTQGAIEEGVATAIAKPRYSIVTVHNSTISNNQWLSYSNLVPGDTVPIRIPLDSFLREISFAFAGTSVDGQFDLYKNGLTAGDIVASITFTNVNNFKLETGLSIPLASGDYIVGRWIDTGTNPSDMCITYFPQVQ